MAENSAGFATTVIAKGVLFHVGYGYIYSLQHRTKHAARHLASSRDPTQVVGSDPRGRGMVGNGNLHHRRAAGRQASME